MKSQTFHLPSHTVTVSRVGNVLEFTTKNDDGDVISTVPRTFAESVPLLRKLACKAA
ncbi:hypothetical protein [Streptomyces sp. NPDC046832]|uniref:hypothetical protein n=1 Tax=Streptomyces sp. NPDC046832 TaxID=3155020 RepID=UPI0033D4F01B